MALKLLSRPKYRKTLQEKLDNCTLHPSVHSLLLQYGYGRPKETSRPRSSRRAEMIYIKATAVGIVSGLVLAIVWVVAVLWLPVEVQMALSSLRHEGAGIGASSVRSGSMALTALIGFVTGFWWTLRRAKRQRQ